MAVKIPLVSEYIYYFRQILRYTGNSFYFLLGITLVEAVFEGLGISMLLPLLKSTDMGGADLEGKGEFLITLLKVFNIDNSFQGILIFMGVVFLLKGVVKFAHGLYQAHIGKRLARDLKADMVNAYSGMNYQDYSANNTGHYANILNAQINRFIQAFKQYSKFSAQLLTTIVYLTMAFFLSWHFTLMAVIGGGLLLFFIRYLSRYTKRISRKVSVEGRNMQKVILQTLYAMKYLKSTATLGRMKADIKNSINRLTSYQFWMSLAAAFVDSIKEPFTVFMIIGLILIQVTIMEQAVAPIMVTLFLFYRSMNTMITSQYSWQLFLNKIGGLEMVADEFNTVKYQQESYGDKHLSKLSTGLKFEHVSFSYDGKEEVLQDIHLTIPKNHMVAFVGESGAGKSTLIDLITCLITPQKGQVYINETPSTEIDYESWRSKIGFVPQETVVFDDSAANNISLWQCDETDEECIGKIQEAAQKSYCHQFLKVLPNGYDTKIGDKGVRLSGGQRQRLSIARELFKRPDLLILDEATSALDTESEKYIQSSIDELKGKMTVVIIAHRLSTIKNADYIYVLEKGRIVEEGTFQSLKSLDSSKFKKMVELQSLEV